ncbi:ATP-binding protein [Halobacillus litoralis]|uniref:ATP-binding protein n=1 Tax=Halobacillus litoralis TaxID=45668 RepID=UPI001CFDC0C5|nr:ATP-binding protein [Halobacillus litoralis]WLR46573.1 ATP-binding protein [Halobacillus litoralis]
MITLDNIAKVVSVLPNKVKVQVQDLDKFHEDSMEKVSIGSYLRVSDEKDCSLIAMVENFTIEENKDNPDEPKYIIEATPMGYLDVEGVFHRGNYSLTIPPTGVELAKRDEIKHIYDTGEEEARFSFAKLQQDEITTVPVDGNKFFNKHIAVVGSTGSGKSHTVAKILQEAISSKNSDYEGLNNSHIVIFDIHSEYKSAFPESNYVDVGNLFLPYWLMNGEELEEIFVETGDNNAYNQISLLRDIITKNKQYHNDDNENITFDTPVPFSMKEVVRCIVNLTNETVDNNDATKVTIIDDDGEDSHLDNDSEKYKHYFEKQMVFRPLKRGQVTRGTYNDSDRKLDKMIFRMNGKINDNRLNFLSLGDQVDNYDTPFVDVLEDIIGYSETNKSNISIIDISGVPFEVLNITVSLVSRLLFEYGYYFKKYYEEKTEGKEMHDEDYLPLMLVYEEAHKYVPKSSEAKYKSSRMSIERIAKEGRKYGVSAMIVSQRPSEISETIFSQCSNFVAMRLTNPEDQNYIKRLLPDSLESLTASISTLQSGQAILTGEAIIMPSLVKIDPCSPAPSSSDIKYLEEWKKPWIEAQLEIITKRWNNS